MAVPSAAKQIKIHKSIKQIIRLLPASCLPPVSPLGAALPPRPTPVPQTICH